MAASLPIKNLVAQIRREHEAGLAHATQAVSHVIRCGQLLVALRSASHGDFDAHLQEAGISKTTAWRYVRLAKDVTGKKGKHLLEQGASLVDLYREFGLVKPCKGGGYSSKAYQARKSLADAQLEIEFSFEPFSEHLAALIKAPNVEQLGDTTIDRMLKDIDAARARLIDLKKNRTAIDLQP